MATGVQLYQHPRFEQMLEYWQLYQDLYDGDHDVLCSKYLVRHAAERKGDADALELFGTRCARTQYLNLQEILVSLWLSIFFRNEGVADGPLTTLIGDGKKPEDEINNIDGKGSSLFTFVKEVTKNILLHGDTYVLADAFPLAANTEAQARLAGARPFLELLTPLEVKDWQIETNSSARFGKFNMLRREFQTLMPRTRATEKPITQIVSHELFINGSSFAVQIYLGEQDEHGNLKIDPGTNRAAWRDGGILTADLTEIPVAYVHGESWMKGAAPEIRRHFNLRSNLDNVDYHHGYEKLVATGVNTEEQRLALSANVVAVLPEGGDLKAIPASEAIGLQKAVSGAVQNVFNVGLNQLRSIAADSKESQAADAQSKEREYTTSLVESELQTVETIINQALGYYAEFKGKPAGRYSLDKEIEAEDFDKWLRVYGSIKDQLSNYPTVNKAAIKKAIAELNLEDEATLLKEVEDTVIETPEAQENDERQELIRQAARG